MKTEWNLEPFYKSLKDPELEKDIKTSQTKVKSFVNKWSKNKQYLKNPKTLKEALDEYEKLHTTTGICDKPHYYLFLKNNLDQTDSNVKGKLNSINDISTKLENDIQFFLLNVSKVSEKQQKIFLESSHLKEYKHFLESLFKSSKYLLTDKEEKIFNLTGKTSHSNWVNMMEELLSKQQLNVLNEKNEKVNINYNEISKYLNSQNKKARDYAAKQFNKVNEKYIEIAEFEINSILERKKVSDEYRNIPRPDLPRHIANDIDIDVVETLVEVVTKNFNTSEQYYKTKCKLLKQKKLGYHERNVPVGDIQKRYKYEDGFNLVKDTFYKIDKSFGDVVNTFGENGQYDVYPKKGKSSGGFCITVNKLLPTYILLNYNNKLNDVLTIAHESGHAIHSEMSKKQNSLNCGYPISLAEIASTFFENFVLEEILKDADEQLRLNILMERLNSDISAIFRQIACFNFEKELHTKFRESGYLNKEEISKLFCKHMKAYLGEYVKEDEGMRNGWIYWSHIRRFFYVYSYASGLLISKALQGMVKEDKRNVALVKEFLSSGSTKSPKDLFKGMGIDIMEKEFWKKGIVEIEDSLNRIK